MFDAAMVLTGLAGIGSAGAPSCSAAHGPKWERELPLRLVGMTLPAQCAPRPPGDGMQAAVQRAPHGADS